jgi:YfiH family protein
MSTGEITLLRPDWPVAAAVRACVSTRVGGVSAEPYASLNLGDHVGDAPAAVAENRRRFAIAAGLAAPPRWLRQVHGVRVVRAEAGGEADACWTDTPGVPCAVLTADCLPVLFAARDGRCVAAAHAGWRGLANGVLEATLAALPVPAGEVIAWLGPAIGPAAFEVGGEVREAFLTAAAADAAAFVPHGMKWHADLFALARARLQRAGVASIHGGGLCTVARGERWFSHRRDGVSGRMASAVWIDAGLVGN